MRGIAKSNGSEFHISFINLRWRANGSSQNNDGNDDARERWRTKFNAGLNNFFEAFLNDNAIFSNFTFNFLQLHFRTLDFFWYFTWFLLTDFRNAMRLYLYSVCLAITQRFRKSYTFRDVSMRIAHVASKPLHFERYMNILALSAWNTVYDASEMSTSFTHFPELSHVR